MSDVLLFRHAPTEWNEAGRIQGRSDRPLSDAGRSLARHWRLPAFAKAWPCRCSPLRRAHETAEAMGLAAVADPAFAEMDWGAWEGQTLAELRAQGGADFAANEAQGFDFRPEGGESPRETGERALLALRHLREDAVIVTHKGVLRPLFALALGWDMRGKAPVRIQAASAHHFTIAPSGAPALVRANIPLDHREGPSP